MTQTRAGISASFLLAALIACGGERDVVRIDGSPGIAPLVSALVDLYRVQTTDSIAIGNGLGSRARLDSLEQGAIDIAMASHGIDSADLARRGLVAHEIARSAVVFAVNAAVPVTGLTSAQLCDIYSGRKPAWQLFGAPTGRITPLMRPADEVDAEVALETIDCLRALTPGSTVSVRERADEMASAIAETPGSIGLTSMTYVAASNGRMRALVLDSIAPSSENVASGRYEMVRRAILVTRANPGRAVESFLRFVRSGDGQQVIVANGGVPSR